MNTYRSIPSLRWAIVLFLAAGLCAAQNKAAQILPEILVLPEQVVEEQWPFLLETVSPPKELRQIEPGQCIRFGVAARGEGRGELLKKASFTFKFSLAGTSQSFPATPAQAVKLTTPSMNEFLINTLFKNQVPKGLPEDGALAASTKSTHWCAPADVQDGTATVEGTVTLADGSHVTLKGRKIDVRTFETARKKVPFKKTEEFEDWFSHFHESPDPALLLPALRIFTHDAKARNEANLTEFFVAALRAHPLAAQELMSKLPSEDRWMRMVTTSILTWAGYETAPLRETLDDHDKAIMNAIHFPDPFDLSPNEAIGARQDMLWAIFFATGSFQSVRTIAGELTWREDYDKLMEHGRQVRASGAPSTEGWPPYGARGAAYAAAGWSMHSISMTDALLNDYIAALKASPETPEQVRKELANLENNPAFQPDLNQKK